MNNTKKSPAGAGGQSIDGRRINDNITPNSVDFNNIPSAMREMSQWVLHRAKQPYSTDRQRASTTDKKTWSGFDQAIDALKSGGFDGIGFVFTAQDDFVGIDLDHCRDKDTGNVTDAAQAIIDKFNSYSEISPSETGVHIIVQGHFDGPGRKHNGIEVYQSGRYFTVTGKHVESTPLTVETRQGELENLIGRIDAARKPTPLPPPKRQRSIPTRSNIIKRASAYVEKMDPAISGQSGHDATFRVAMVLLEGFGLSIDEAHPILDEFNRRCEPPWSAKELEHKLASAKAKIDPALAGQLVNDAIDFRVLEGGEAGPGEIALEAFDEKGHVIPLNVARMIGLKHPHLVHVSGDFWDFTGRVYEEIPVQYIDGDAIALIGRAARRSGLMDIRHLLAVESFHEPDFFDLSGGFIVLENGVLDIASRELRAFSPDIHARNLMPIEYDANADCPRFRQCLAEWLPDDPGARDVLVEWLGYCLVQDTSQHKMLILLGEGGNGKSVYIAVAEMVLGAANIAGMPLAALRADRTFPTAGLMGKLVNICPESELSGEIDEGWIKSLISGDSVEVERKGRDPFTMRPTARFILQSNNPPRIKDRSDGIWRRLMPVRFSRTFTESEQDRELPEKLRAELPGILNLALDGLHRLAMRGRFEFTETMRRELQSYRDECNPLAAWKNERLITVEPDLSGHLPWLPTVDAYSDYREWCHDMGHSPAARLKFTRDIKRLGVEEVTPKDTKGKTIRALAGVELTCN